MGSIKKTLWTFGDSHTAGHGCIPGYEYYEKYRKEGDEIWPVYLSQWLDTDLENMGVCGASNDMILDSIGDSFDRIKSGDIVIIGKTYSHRFDVPHPKKEDLYPICYDWDKIVLQEGTDEFSSEQIEAIVNFQYHFMLSPLFEIRWNKRYDWVKRVLENMGCKCIIWDVNTDLREYETIMIHTNRKMEDYHMSFKGHKQIGLFMFNNWFKEKTLL